jgi:hypothetical protein
MHCKKKSKQFFLLEFLHNNALLCFNTKKYEHFFTIWCGSLRKFDSDLGMFKPTKNQQSRTDISALTCRYERILKDKIITLKT